MHSDYFTLREVFMEENFCKSLKIGVLVEKTLPSVYNNYA